MNKVFVLIDGNWYYSREAAKLLGVSPATICNRIKSGKLKSKVSDLYQKQLHFKNKYGIKFNGKLVKSLDIIMNYHNSMKIAKQSFLKYCEMSPKERMGFSLDRCILLYGKKHGRRKFVQYKETQSNYGKSRIFDRKNSPRCVEYWIERKGLSEADAILMVSSTAKQHAINANLNRPPESQCRKIEYWRKKCASEEYARKKLREHQTNRKIDISIISELRKYYVNVWWYTKQNLHKVPNIEKRSNDYHLDHIFSIRNGFDCSVDPCIIGSEVNLRIISAYENNTKYSRSDIELEELYEKYNNR